MTDTTPTTEQVRDGFASYEDLFYAWLRKPGVRKGIKRISHKKDRQIAKQQTEADQ